MTGPGIPLGPQGQRQLAAVLRVLTRWGVPHAQQAQLLGFSGRDLRRAQRGTPPATLSREGQDRLRLVAGILAALLTLYGRDPGGWLTRPNHRDPFDGRPPLTVLIAGGLSALLATHRLLAGDLNGQFSSTLESRQRAAALPQPPIEPDG